MFLPYYHNTLFSVIQTLTSSITTKKRQIYSGSDHEKTASWSLREKNHSKIYIDQRVQIHKIENGNREYVKETTSRPKWQIQAQVTQTQQENPTPGWVSAGPLTKL